MSTKRFSWIMRGGMLAALFLAGRVDAAPVPVDDVVRAVRGWLALMDRAPLGEQLGSGLQFMAPETDAEGRVLYYAVHLENGGLVAMAPDDAIEPVIAFTPRAEGFDDPSPCNHLRRMLESDLRSRLARVEAGLAKEAGVKSAKWALLIQAAQDPLGVKGGLSGISDVRVPPLTYSRWNQSYVYQGSTRLACYNYYTPPYTAGAYQNYYCGCVATALAQLMYYHKHPKTGVGKVTRTIHVDGSAYSRNTRGGNGSGGAYDWANMPADPAGLAKAGRLNNTQRAAVGALCHDAAVGSQKSFTGYGSSAYLCWSEGNHPLQTIFKYASVKSPWVADTSTFLKSDMNQALNPNLDAGLPCAISIRNNSGDGHAVVVDGYGYAYGNVYHHLNMGWGGLDTAWYNLPTVKSVQDTPYFRVTGLVFNLHPTLANLSLISGRVLNLAGKPMAGVKVVARHTGGTLPNKSAVSNSRGIFAIKALPGEWTVKPAAAGFGFKPDSATVTINASRNAWGENFKAVTRVMRLSTASLAFGRVNVDTDATLPVKVFNDGTASLTVTGVTCPDGFFANPSAFTVPPGGSVRVVVHFFPSGGVSYSGNLVFKSNRSGGPNTVALTGRGVGSGSGLPGLVLIPAGTFTMGDAFTEGDASEWPAHPVALDAFYMAKTETTKQMWDQVRSWGLANGYTDLPAGFAKATNHPVSNVTWYDCVKWCNARSQMEGRTPVYGVVAGSDTNVMKTGTDQPVALWSANGYRLPTEAEWEKAARGGLTGKRFPWGDTIAHSQANYYSPWGTAYAYDVSATDGYHPTYDTTMPYVAPVMAFAPNGYGLYEMAGNLSEWCWNAGLTSYTSLTETNPRGPLTGTYRVWRGGGWDTNPGACRVSYRTYTSAGYSYDSIGFRVAVTAQPQ